MIEYFVGSGNTPSLIFWITLGIIYVLIEILYIRYGVINTDTGEKDSLYVFLGGNVIFVAISFFITMGIGWIVQYVIPDTINHTVKNYKAILLISSKVFLVLIAISIIIGTKVWIYKRFVEEKPKKKVPTSKQR